MDTQQKTMPSMSDAVCLSPGSHTDATSAASAEPSTPGSRRSKILEEYTDDFTGKGVWGAWVCPF